MSGQPDSARGRADTARRHREALRLLQADPGTLAQEHRRAALRRGTGRRFAGLEVTRGQGSRAVLELPDQLLVRVGDRAEVALGLVDAAGFRGEAVDGLRGRVVRVRTVLDARAGSDAPTRRDDRALRRRVAALRSSLDAVGMRSSFVQLAPTGVVMKSTISPELPPPGDLPVLPATPSGAAGATVPVVVLDTGLAVRARQDGWLAGLQHADNTDPLDEWPQPNGYLDLSAGHGTFVAGLVQRVDPLLDLSVVKVLDSDGLADEVEVAVALVRAVEDRLVPGGKLVVNLSLGSETVDDLPPVALEAALELVRELEAGRGGEVLVVASAGNDGSEVPCWPAAFAATDPRVVAVAATGADGAPAAWSTHGAWVTCSTEGEAVLSTFVPGTEDPGGPPSEVPVTPADTFGPDAWAWWTGTSFAAPQVAAAVASRARTSGSSLADALAAVLSEATGHAPGYGGLLPARV